MPTKDQAKVVVSGMGVVCAVATDVAQFNESLQQGKDGISRIRAFPTDGMRSECAGEVKTDLHPRSLGLSIRKPMDRASVLALKASREAIADSSLYISEKEALLVGVSMGSCGGGYLSGLEYLSESRYRHIGPGNLLLDLPLHSAASHISCELRVYGGINVVSNACASGAIAIAYGFERIRSGKAVAMVVGGYDALSPLNCAGFGIMRNSSPSNRIRPFDKNRDGMLLGEGAAVLVLESMEHCQSRGGNALAQILGYAISSDTYHLTAPDPSGKGAAVALDSALVDAAVSSEDVDYVNSHGTGTIYNDRMECLALKRVFGDYARRIPISSTKSMTGHTLGASGAIELVSSIIAMRYGFLPPTINYKDSDPNCDIDCVPNEARQAKIDLIVSNSFGFGGTNCSIVVGRC